MPTLSHVSVGVTDIPRARKFYDSVLAALQIKMLVEFEGAGYGREFPEFWIGHPHDGKPMSAGNGTHICFSAGSKEEVDAFHAKALELGGSDEGKPGLRPEYLPNYYAAFKHNPKNNKNKTVCLLK